MTSAGLAKHGASEARKRNVAREARNKLNFAPPGPQRRCNLVILSIRAASPPSRSRRRTVHTLLLRHSFRTAGSCDPRAAGFELRQIVLGDSFPHYVHAGFWAGLRWRR